MSNPVPKWIMQRYAVLWKKLGSSKFTYKEAVKILKKDKMISIALSELRRSGWLELSLDPKDARKRIYSLKNPQKVVEEIAE